MKKKKTKKIIENVAQIINPLSPQRKEAWEDQEKLDILGHDDEKKAAPLVIEEGNAALKKQKEDEAKQFEKVNNSAKFTIKEYNHVLADTIANMMRYFEIIQPGWNWQSWATKEGVGLTLLSPKKERYYRAFKPSHEPLVDYRACKVVVQSADETIFKMEKAERLGRSGIYIAPEFKNVSKR